MRVLLVLMARPVLHLELCWAREDSSWVSQRLVLTLSGSVRCPGDAAFPMQASCRVTRSSAFLPGTFSLLLTSVLREPVI